MSKRARIIIAAVCLAVLLGSTITFVIYRKTRSNAQSVLESSKSSDVIDDIFSKKYSRSEPLSKAKKAVNGVWVFESEISGKASYSLDVVCSDIFDSVFLSTKYLMFTNTATSSTAYDSDYTPDNDELSAIANTAQKLRDNSKSVIISVNINSINGLIKAACNIGSISGIILQGLDGKNEAAAAKRLRQVYSLIKAENESLTVYADIPYKWKDFSLAAKGCMDVLYSEIDSDVDRISATVGDYSSYSYTDCAKADTFDAWSCYWNRRAKESSLGFYIGYRADFACSERYNGYADSTLIQTILSDSCDTLGGRVYRSYKSVVTDTDNSMSSVVTFITKGINILLACRRLSIADYSGETLESSTGLADFTVKCSNVFPLYIGGQSYGVQKRGEYKISSELSTGLNSFRISQNGCSIVYKIEYTANAVSPLLTFIVPDSEVRLNGGEMLDITVGGHIAAHVTATIGKQTVKLQREKESYGAYTTFSASIKMPDASEKQQNLGQILLTAKADGVDDETYKGANVIINAKKSDVTTAKPQDNVTGTTLRSDNAELTTNEVITSPYQQQQGSSYYGSSEQTTQLMPLDKSAVSKVCIIAANSAETRPVTPLSNTYIPTFTPLASGTLDKITDVVQYNDGDDTIQYYVLASGRRVSIADASVLESCTLSDNSINLKSCSSADGSAELLLSTKWKIPYNVTLSPQSYKSGYEGKLYNVSSFTADKMEITFWYTDSVSGSADFSSCDIISSCSWSTDKSAKMSTLTLNFKNTGRFYGYSIGYNESGEMYIKISNRVGKLSGSVIMIDPGHGGKDVGALGLNGRVYESSINLYISQLLANCLIAQGATVYMTRTDNSHVSLAERRAQCELVKPDLFISIHCNGSENTSTHGTSTYYYNPWSKPLASSINSYMTSLFDNALYTPGQSSNLGANFYAFSVCRPTVCPSVLVETAFITNANDCNILMNQQSASKIAEAIGNGISDYLNSQA